MKESGFEYVDLGLPSYTMWATCNVGATELEDPGLLFQFGKIKGYKYGDKHHTFCDFDKIDNTLSGGVYKDNDILELTDDAAHVNMGGRWRIPTKNELKELLNNTRSYVKDTGVLFVSKINGNSIFIPKKAYWSGEYFKDMHSLVFWSSQINSTIKCNAFCFNRYGSINTYVWTAALPIRPVFTQSKNHMFELKLNENNNESVITVNLLDGTDIIINSDINIKQLYKFFELTRNDILLNNLDKDYTIEWLERIKTYNIWLKETYIPKFGQMDNFFDLVYAWVKEDLSNFALYCGLDLKIVDE